MLYWSPLGARFVLGVPKCDNQYVPDYSPLADLLVTLLCIANSPRILFRYKTASVWDRKVQPTSSPRQGDCSEGQWASCFTRLRGGMSG